MNVSFSNFIKITKPFSAGSMSEAIQPSLLPNEKTPFYDTALWTLSGTWSWIFHQASYCIIQSDQVSEYLPYTLAKILPPCNFYPLILLLPLWSYLEPGRSLSEKLESILRRSSSIPLSSVFQGRFHCSHPCSQNHYLQILTTWSFSTEHNLMPPLTFGSPRWTWHPSSALTRQGGNPEAITFFILVAFLYY